MEIQPVNPKGNQSWGFIGRTDAEAETPILWPPDAKNCLIGKDPDAGKDWRQEEKGTTGDEMVGWYHWLNGHEFEQAPVVGEGQRSLACCSPWGHKESDTTKQLNWKLCGILGPQPGIKLASPIRKVSLSVFDGAPASYSLQFPIFLSSGKTGLLSTSSSFSIPWSTNKVSALLGWRSLIKNRHKRHWAREGPSQDPPNPRGSETEAWDRAELLQKYKDTVSF